MHYTALLSSSLALLSVSSAFVLPANLADGTYQVRRSANGAEVHSSLSQPALRRSVTTPSSSLHNLAKRDTYGNTWCGCGFSLNPVDTDAAVADLKAQVTDPASDEGKFIEPGLSYYSIRGATVAFVCNYDDDSYLRVWPDVVTDAFGQVTDACGLYVAGTAGGVFDSAIGYMQNFEGLDFCGAALGSPAITCPH